MPLALTVPCFYSSPRHVCCADLEQYVTEMLRCMRDVNVDNNTVGWYMSTYMNNWLDPEGPTVATQFQFQDSVPKSVCLVYDPVRTLSGSVHLKAYRLTDRFMAKYRDHQEKQAADKNQHGFTETDIRPKYDWSNKLVDEGITIDDIFEEVPIRIHNSALVMAMLYDWACEGSLGGAKLHCDFERLDLSSRPFLEKSVENMVDGIEALRQDQERAEYRKRDAERKRKDARRNASQELSKEELQKMFPDPSRLEGLLIANQVRSYCDSISNFTGQSLSKLYLVKALQDGN
jgi:translation initiation factor 3 subunit H